MGVLLHLMIVFCYIIQAPCNKPDLVFDLHSYHTDIGFMLHFMFQHHGMWSGKQKLLASEILEAA